MAPRSLQVNVWEVGMWVPGSESSLGMRTAVSQHTPWPSSVAGTPTAGSASQEKDLPCARLESQWLRQP